MEKGEVLVKVEDASKKFCRNLKRSLWYGLTDIARNMTGTDGKTKIRKDEFWAVKDISFEVRRGECLGLIGHNGAGKSTLLKMLNGLIRPDQGRIKMHGRTGALIELGAGFNPVLSGRENVYTNGAVLGFSRQEIDKKFNDIVAFAEMKEFIDMPVQNYSSGMKVRLGFAVAAQMEPDILLVDEVLAVGDIGFVLKCFNKMDALLKNTAIILVSHNIPQIARMCTNLLLMERGQNIYFSENVSAGITKYYQSFKNEVGNFEGTDKVTVSKISLGSKGRVSTAKETFTVHYGDNLDISIELSCKTPIHRPNIWLTFYDKEQRPFADVRNFKKKLMLDTIEENIVFTAHIPSIQFAQGNYSITIGLWEEKDGVRETLFRYQSAIFFNVDGDQHGWAPIQLATDWSVKSHQI